MNANDYDKRYNCTFTQCEREKQLDERLLQYYQQSEDCSNKLTKYYWNSFKHWCDYRGFTTKEINKAKKRVEEV